MSWSSLPHSERERLRSAVLRRDRGVCQLKLEGCTHRATHADHIAPRETAGDGVDNLQSACQSCNLRKGSPKRRDPEVDRPAWL